MSWTQTNTEIATRSFLKRTIEWTVHSIFFFFCCTWWMASSCQNYHFFFKLSAWFPRPFASCSVSVSGAFLLLLGRFLLPIAKWMLLSASVTYFLPLSSTNSFALDRHFPDYCCAGPSRILASALDKNKQSRRGEKMYTNSHSQIKNK